MARRQVRYAALAAAAALVLGGCGTASPQTAPTGVDELVVPTPSPDPGDFVAGVDNPWLAYGTPGTWVYQAQGAAGEGQVTVTVQDRTVEVAGVATTPVARTGLDGVEVLDYVAQDRRGNVWWFGREGAWRAGEDGAEAGLLMPAAPRYGDGWRGAYEPGVAEPVLTVASTEESATTPAGRYTDLVGVDVADPLDPGAAVRRYFARGVGMVEEVTTEGPVSVLELVTPPSG